MEFDMSSIGFGSDRNLQEVEIDHCKFSYSHLDVSYVIPQPKGTHYRFAGSENRNCYSRNRCNKLSRR